MMDEQIDAAVTAMLEQEAARASVAQAPAEPAPFTLPWFDNSIAANEAQMNEQVAQIQKQQAILEEMGVNLQRMIGALATLRGQRELVAPKE